MFCAALVTAFLLAQAAVPAQMPAFFSRLDMGRPGLNVVRAAVESNDPQAAASAWAGYVRGRCASAGLQWNDSGIAPASLGTLGTLLALARERNAPAGMLALDTLLRGAPSDEAILAAGSALRDGLDAVAAAAKTASGAERQRACAAGLLLAGLLPEFQDAGALYGEFLAMAGQGMTELPSIGLPDGMTPADAASYTEWVAANAALTEAGSPLVQAPPQASLERARALLEDVFYFCLPPCLFPGGDAGGCLRPYPALKDGGAALPPLFAARALWAGVPPPPDMAWLLGGGTLGYPPIFTTWPETFADPTPGLYAFRRNWDADSPFFAAGLWGTGKQPAPYDGDYVLYSNGVRMVSGAFGVSDPLEKNGTAPKQGGQEPLFVSLDTFDCAIGASGPVSELVRNAYPVHTRSIFFIKPNLFVVADHVAGTLSTPVTWGVELAPGMQCDVNGKTVKAIHASGASLKMAVAGNVEAPVAQPGDSGATRLTFEQTWRLPVAWAAVYSATGPGEYFDMDVTADPAERGFGRGMALNIAPEGAPTRYVLFINNERGPSQFPDHDLLLGGKAALFDIQVRPRAKYLLIRRMTFLETSAIAYQRKGSEWVLSFDKPFTGLVEFNPHGGFPGGRVQLDASAKVREMIMRLRLRDGAALEMKIRAGENVNIEAWELEQKEE